MTEAATSKECYNALNKMQQMQFLTKKKKKRELTKHVDAASEGRKYPRIPAFMLLVH